MNGIRALMKEASERLSPVLPREPLWPPVDLEVGPHHALNLPAP